jgi:hypothetical protein
LVHFRRRDAADDALKIHVTVGAAKVCDRRSHQGDERPIECARALIFNIFFSFSRGLWPKQYSRRAARVLC